MRRVVRATRALAGPVRRHLRRVRARLFAPEARCVYHVGYAPPENGTVDPKRASKILDYLLGEGYLAPHGVEAPPPLDLAALRRVHDDAYLERLDHPPTIANALGLPPEALPPGTAAAFLSSQRWATAGTAHAAAIARDRGAVVANLGGGFHHADRGRAGGFCVFNDTAVAVDALRRRGFGGRVLVVDFDLHQGEGTRRIFRDDRRVFCVSVHATTLDDTPSEGAIDLALGPGVDDATYLPAVREALERAAAFGRPDFLFYLAGVDVALGDALGGWRVSADAIAARDRLVLERFRGVPAVLTLAGGYGRDAWRHSARTLAWLFGGVDRPLDAASERGLRHVRRLARALGDDELTEPSAPTADNFGIREADVMAELVTKSPGGRLLGFYTPFGVELALDRYGVTAALRARGYAGTRVELDPSEPSRQTLRVRTDDAARRLLVELVVGEKSLPPYRLLSIESLLLQDPLARPTASRPLLPGQAYPGLGCGRNVIGMLAAEAERLGFDGLAYVPAYFHTAERGRGLFRFLDPATEAALLAIKDAAASRPLLEATRFVDGGLLIDERTGEPFVWRPSTMVLPLSPALKAELEGPDFDRRVREAALGLKLRLRLPAAGP